MIPVDRDIRYRRIFFGLGRILSGLFLVGVLLFLGGIPDQGLLGALAVAADVEEGGVEDGDRAGAGSFVERDKTVFVSDVAREDWEDRQVLDLDRLADREFRFGRSRGSR